MSFGVFARLAEERIGEAMRRGDFDNLPGRGLPLPEDDDAMIPEDLRLAFKALRNAGYVPPEVTERREIETMRDLLEHIGDAGERYRQMQKLNLLITKYNIGHRRHVALEKDQVYFERIVSRVPLAKPAAAPGREGKIR